MVDCQFKTKIVCVCVPIYELSTMNSELACT